MMNCPWCNKQFQNESSIVRHSSRIHSKSRADYELLMTHSSISPICRCGCGEHTSYSKRRRGFNEFIVGHQTRDVLIRAKMIKSGIAASQDIKKRKKNSDAIKKKWEDNSYRASQELSLKRTLESRMNKIRSTKKSEKYKKEQSERSLRWWSDDNNRKKMIDIFSTKQFKDKVSTSVKLALDNPEIRKILSNHAAQMSFEGITKPYNSKRSWVFNKFTNKFEHVDSTWEFEFLTNAMKFNVPVTRNSTLKIGYRSENDSDHLYIPDFITLDSHIIIEIKGRVTSNDLLKFAACETFCEQNNKSFVIFNNMNSIKDDQSESWKKLNDLINHCLTQEVL